MHLMTHQILPNRKEKEKMKVLKLFDRATTNCFQNIQILVSTVQCRASELASRLLSYSFIIILTFMSFAIATRLIYIFFPAVSEHFVKLYQLC